MELSHTELVFPYVVHELVPTADQCPVEELREFAHMDETDSSPKGQGRTILLDAEENSYCLVDDEQFVVKAFRLFHRIPSFGFSVVEKKRAGKLNAQKLRDLGKHTPPSLYLRFQQETTEAVRGSLSPVLRGSTHLLGPKIVFRTKLKYLVYLNLFLLAP